MNSQWTHGRSRTFIRYDTLELSTAHVPSFPALASLSRHLPILRRALCFTSPLPPLDSSSDPHSSLITSRSFLSYYCNINILGNNKRIIFDLVNSIHSMIEILWICRIAIEMTFKILAFCSDCINLRFIKRAHVCVECIKAAKWIRANVICQRCDPVCRGKIFWSGYLKRMFAKRRCFTETTTNVAQNSRTSDCANSRESTNIVPYCLKITQYSVFRGENMKKTVINIISSIII